MLLPISISSVSKSLFYTLTYSYHTNQLFFFIVPSVCSPVIFFFESPSHTKVRKKRPVFKFEQYDFEDVKQILNELTQITFTPGGIEYLATRVNQFRQIVKLINKIEKLAITNQLKQIDENILRKLLYGRSNIETLQKGQQIYA